MKNVRESEFKTTISQGLVLVDFYANWCGPCKMVSPILEQLSEKYNNKIEIVKLDVDDANVTARNYNIQSIPTIIMFNNGTEVDRQIGFNGPASIENMIKKFI